MPVPHLRPSYQSPGLRSSEQQPFAAQGLSRVSMSTISLTPLTAAVRTLNVPNVRSFSRDLALAALCFLRAVFLSARCPRHFSRANVLRLSLSSRCSLHRFLPSFFRPFGCSTPNMPRLLHRRYFFLLAYALRASLLSSLWVPHFPRRQCTNFAAKGTVAAGNDFACWVASPPVDAVSRLALSASTSSRINRRQEGILIHARTLYPARRVTAVVTYPGTFLQRSVDSVGPSQTYPNSCCRWGA